MQSLRAANLNHFGLIAWQPRAKPKRLKHCVVYVPADEKNNALLQNILAQCLNTHYRVTVLEVFNEEALATLKPDLILNFGLTLTTPLLTINAPAFNTLRSTPPEKRKFYKQLRPHLVSE